MTSTFILDISNSSRRNSKKRSAKRGVDVLLGPAPAVFPTLDVLRSSKESAKRAVWGHRAFNGGTGNAAIYEQRRYVETAVDTMLFRNTGGFLVVKLHRPTTDLFTTHASKQTLPPCGIIKFFTLNEGDKSLSIHQSKTLCQHVKPSCFHVCINSHCWPPMLS